MNNLAKIVIVAALVVVVGGVLATKQTQRNKSGATCCRAWRH